MLQDTMLPNGGTIMFLLKRDSEVEKESKINAGDFQKLHIQFQTNKQRSKVEAISTILKHLKIVRSKLRQRFPQGNHPTGIISFT